MPFTVSGAGRQIQTYYKEMVDADNEFDKPST
jgi:hypothetical protein